LTALEGQSAESRGVWLDGAACPLISATPHTWRDLKWLLPHNPPAPLQIFNETNVHTHMITARQCRAIGIAPMAGLYEVGQ